MRKFKKNAKKKSVIKNEKSKSVKAMGYFIMALMILSLAGFVSFHDSGEIENINGFEFTQESHYWKSKINGKQMFFNYLPNQVNDINISNNVLFNANAFQFTYDPDDENVQDIAVTQFNMIQNLREGKNVFVSTGMSSQNEFELPIITCNETSTQMPVVYFKSANYTRISEENGCILVEGANSYDFLRLKDRFLYAVYNVI